MPEVTVQKLLGEFQKQEKRGKGIYAQTTFWQGRKYKITVFRLNAKEHPDDFEIRANQMEGG